MATLELGKPTARGVRKCPRCGTFTGTRGNKCKLSTCQHVFVSSRKPAPPRTQLKCVRVVDVAQAKRFAEVFSVQTGRYRRGVVICRRFVERGAPATCYVRGCPGKAISEGNVQLTPRYCSHIELCLSMADNVNLERAYELKLDPSRMSDRLEDLGLPDKLLTGVLSLVSRKAPVSIFRLAKSVFLVKTASRAESPERGHILSSGNPGASGPSGNPPNSAATSETNDRGCSSGYCHIVLLPGGLEPKYMCECWNFKMYSNVDVRNLPPCSHFIVLSLAMYLNVDYCGAYGLDYQDWEFAVPSCSKPVRMRPVTSRVNNLFTARCPGATYKNVLKRSSAIREISREEKSRRMLALVEESSSKPLPSNAEESSVRITFLQWLASVTEQINHLHQYDNTDESGTISSLVPESFYQCLEERLKASWTSEVDQREKCRLPDETTSLGSGETVTTWRITSILHVKAIFDTPQVPLLVQKTYESKANALPTHAPKVTRFNTNTRPIRPLERKTFLDVGTGSDESSVFTIQWTHGGLPLTNSGLLRLSFRFRRLSNEGQVFGVMSAPDPAASVQVSSSQGVAVDDNVLLPLSPV